MNFDDPKTLLAIGTDSSSALALIKRDGASRRSRHLDLRTFFLQDLARKKVITPFKTPGVENVSDIYTKVLSTPPPWLLKSLGFYPCDGIRK